VAEADGLGTGSGLAPGAAATGTPDGDGVGARVRGGVGAGVDTGSPKPGGRIDSGLSCPSAGRSPTPTRTAAIAPSATLVREIRKRHDLLDMNQRFFMRMPSEKKQPANHHDKNDDERNQQTRHA
jgi:hypothetical protein